MSSLRSTSSDERTRVRALEGRGGAAARLVGAVLGAWAALALMAAPFLLRFQAPGAPWAPSTSASEWMGALTALWALAAGVPVLTGPRPAVAARRALPPDPPPAGTGSPSQQLEQLARRTLDELEARPGSAAPRSEAP